MRFPAQYPSEKKTAAATMLQDDLVITILSVYAEKNEERQQEGHAHLDSQIQLWPVSPSVCLMFCDFCLYFRKIHCMNVYYNTLVLDEKRQRLIFASTAVNLSALLSAAVDTKLQNHRVDSA